MKTWMHDFEFSHETEDDVTKTERLHSLDSLQYSVQHNVDHTIKYVLS